MKWTKRFLDLAGFISAWSKDPSTKVGAVAVDRVSRAVLETGYNGLPRYVEDLPERMERPAKYMWTSHAEENLVAHAARKVLEHSTVYCTHLCCARCARSLINAGVSKVVCGSGATSMPAEEFEIARIMFEEAHVELVLIELPAPDSLTIQSPHGAGEAVQEAQTVRTRINPSVF